MQTSFAQDRVMGVSHLQQELRLGGNMARFMWTINGKKFSEADPVSLRYGDSLIKQDF